MPFGIAPSLFSPEFASLADHSRRRADLEAKKLHFESMFNEIGREIVAVANVPAGVTEDSIAAAIEAIDVELARGMEQRDVVLRQARQASFANVPMANDRSGELGARLGQLRDQRATGVANSSRGKRS
jgi:hypothetical protein